MIIMGLEKYLLEEEKNNIKSISNIQAQIIERREIIRRTLKGESITKKTVNSILNRDYVGAYQDFLKKEGFFVDNEKKIKNTKNTKEDDLLNSYEIKYFDTTLSDFYIYNKSILSEILGGISNIDKIEKFIKEYQDYSKKLSKNDSAMKISYIFNDKLKRINGNIISLMQILGDSKDDIIDYYSNKTQIINLLKALNNQTNSFLKDIHLKKL